MRTAIEEQSIPLPITIAAVQKAREFAQQQSDREKQNQVYLNTLAVWVVNDYMQMMEIETDLTKSDSWNQVMQFCANVADLKLTGLGNLECRPIKDNNLCQIPPEVPDDRIGLVVVEIDINEQEATLLGFSKIVRPGTLFIRQLQPIDDLLEHLEQLIEQTNPIQLVVKLGQWLNNLFETDWQPVELVLAHETGTVRKVSSSSLSRSKKRRTSKGAKPLQNREMNFIDSLESPASVESWDMKFDESLEMASPAPLESEEIESEERIEMSSPASAKTQVSTSILNIRRGKVINLGSQLVVLVVSLTSTTTAIVNICLQLYPESQSTYLPTKIQMIVLDEQKIPYLETQARDKDTLIQLELSVELGKQFSVQIVVAEINITEIFAI